MFDVRIKRKVLVNKGNSLISCPRHLAPDAIGLDAHGGHHCHSASCTEPGTATKPTPTTARATTTAPRPTTTTTESTTTTSTTTTTTIVVLPGATPTAAESDRDAGPVDGALTVLVLGGMGYGGYRLLRRIRRSRAA
ncbi:MAG: hypothetical protein KY443_09440 [Actinobacteria bacterium]|nr:hypothetical protein [Actinomycetota bacterium]